MIQPNATIIATVDYRLVGVLNATGQPANCSIVVTRDNSTVQHEIYNGTPGVGNVTEGSAAFSFTAPDTEGIYNLRYYWNWSVSGNGSAAAEREAIGVILVSSSGSMEWLTSGPDNDHDMLIDLNELIGWDVTFTNASGSYTIHVNSDIPLRGRTDTRDTDSDGLTDGDEYSYGYNSTNPRDVDTDDDGLWDAVELKIGTNPITYDIDGDGIDDSTEITFGSHPNDPDPDGDNLNDSMEFELGSDPWNPDTDGDGLRDGDEWACGSSVLQPDPDADTLFDKLECELGSDPWNPDTDDDGLNDGYEYFIFESSPIHNDTDFDLLLDGDELFWVTDPVCNDTDGDGLNDSRELYLGTNPLFEDTDYDAINDSEDMDSYAPHVDPIILAYDYPDADTDEFMMNLKRYTNVTNVSAAELLVNYTDAPYIVLVGRPDGNDTVGNITATLLNDSQDILTQMIESDYDRFEVKYGVWNSTQTIVMLSHPYPSDHWRVLTIFKSKTETVLPNSIEVKWPTPRVLFGLDTENTLKQTDSLIWVALEEAVTPWVKMSRYNADTTPIALTRTSGLGYDEAVGRYLEIEVSENVQNETGDVIERALIRIYYTATDLDRTGDGDANDVADINESKLKLYRFDESSGHWIALSENMDWVFGTGVDTTNVELYGKRYEGYVWANVSHFSLFGIASEGKAPPRGGYTPRDSDSDGWSDINEMLKGTDPNNPDTDGDGFMDSEDPYPLDPLLPLPPITTPSPSVTPITTSLITPAPETTPASTETPMATPKPWLPIPGFEVMLWLLAVAFAVVSGSVSRSGKNK